MARTSSRREEGSPDSVILTAESNFGSLFSSSASASVDRCSFASDALSHASSSSDASLPLGSDTNQDSSGSGPDHHHRLRHHHRRHPSLHRPPSDIIVPLKGQKEDKASSTSHVDGLLPDSTRNSFSLALKECQERRSRSDAVPFHSKLDRRRPASLDLNAAAGAATISPGTAKSGTSGRPAGGNFPSPATPSHHRLMTKGWSSERVPPPSSSAVSARRGGAQPYNPAGRALPSKWEDAERWICSPVSAAQQSGPNGPRRPKSKSGPLGPPGFASHHSLYSPLPGGSSVPAYDSGSGNAGGRFLAGPSPFSAGVIGVAGGLNGGVSTGTMTHVGLPTRNEPCMARSVSVHGCSKMMALQSLNSLDDKLDGFKDAATDISRAVSRRDMATQMSPEGSGHSSPDGRLSFSALTPSALPIVELELQNIGSSKCDVRDVQVDERVTVTRWSRRHRSRNRKKSSEIIDDWMRKTGDAQSLGWDMSNAAKSISKSKREEAKINAWENLQKAKAEAAIRKLEMKLEKKRTSSMDKIMNKLRSAQKRAQEMRSAVLSDQALQVSKTSRKAVAFRRTRQMGPLGGCFTCHAF